MIEVIQRIAPERTGMIVIRILSDSEFEVLLHITARIDDRRSKCVRCRQLKPVVEYSYIPYSRPFSISPSRNTLLGATIESFVIPTSKPPVIEII